MKLCFALIQCRDDDQSVCKNIVKLQRNTVRILLLINVSD